MTQPQRPKHVEAGDPYAFVASRYPVADARESDRELARCLVEEYAMFGFSPEKVLRLFQLPTYTATYAIGQRRGEAFVNEIITGVFGRAPVQIPLVPREEPE